MNINILIFYNYKGLDGWTSPLGQSLYAFIIITRSKKE